ncbi:MAG TPA: NAD(P)-dependent oxidoreductase [Xanthobacteraceae bacterium]|jgi:nucleoside-diphosphate-sugar epimerase
MRIFLAGASGVVGRRLLPLLLGGGYQVIGTTRSPEKAAELRSAGITPAIVDVFDAVALRRAVLDARPDVVIHQLTDLPRAFDPKRLAEAYLKNARIRMEGTRNLIAAAQAASARRLIVQSVAFGYGAGSSPHRETDQLDVAEGPRAVTMRAVAAMEQQALGAHRLESIVLRYGLFYGPGTWFEAADRKPSLHVDAAAHAAYLAVGLGSAGIYNVADEDGAVSIAKARAQLGFDPAFRLPA